MAYLEERYFGYGGSAAEASTDARIGFIRRTYAHLALAVAACVGLEAILLNTPAVTEFVMRNLFGAGRLAWLGVMALFVFGGMAARGLASSSTSKGAQYAGLALEVLVWSLVLLPVLLIAEMKSPGGKLATQAGLMTLVVFGGLTVTVFVTKSDFSFLGMGLTVAGFLAFAMVLIAVIFGLSLGIWFTFLMLALACGYILYDTSNILHHYGTEQHVLAAVVLFGSVATLFYYILSLLLQSNRSE
ncbi:Bax inhibitor-1/YccA family protein [Tuwongella immobilis]|uniref:Permease n=1 Tax=Tuwongella immobilis TaxID=692036 RepID=A0A6C2YT23_9BACT|nr:Bax inhibitor-1 family protein [Tuwongella immobilis]VIP04032.1 Integral membrane protein, interacts with FtsH OS=Rubidibacter lacunae KORDI 51-2 GN=KR51_00033220 PE=4 SV=1: Bax1-I [Tuwongella immobilis]VTS05431.1 Integral membrane protein, interacts with FtsH OS=Rubidibacter lacunae KORDI 51-2 GN=KR51_00033220 PE=4 SV=1: Bax1-I [Tuwongella immobilis]